MFGHKNSTSAGQARGPGQPKTDKEMLTNVQLQDRQRKHAVTGAVGCADAFVTAIQRLNDAVPFDGVQLVSNNLPRHRGSLPRALRADVDEHIVSLARKLAALVESTAAYCEDVEYYDVEQAASRVRAGNIRLLAARLVSGEKHLHLSGQALRTTVELCARLNEVITQRIATGSAGEEQERELLLANAILVYEIASFVADFIERFHMDGYGEIEKVYHEVWWKIDAERKNLASLRQRAKSAGLGEEATRKAMEEIREHEVALTVSEQAWTDYVGEQHRFNQGCLAQARQLLPIVQFRRDAALSRISVLSVLALTGMVKNMVNEMNAAALAVLDLEMVPLTPDRLHRLFGLGSPPVEIASAS